ncbi:DUF445 domain-containing protein [Corynebacterium caspium]|uniref:DUF445 domain-containing protein n=1 Tax=Corynebacterium caspium TaxID=234828 RepID=UPI000380601C|nr:DUF445 family protein [Corynebacterium caspium]
MPRHALQPAPGTPEPSVSPALSAPPAPADADSRRRSLRNHKILVTALLVFAAITFLACTWWEHHLEGIPGSTVPRWLGYVRAGAEAGMVGGLADWFAVTALFKHPMGIPIPHTALIPRKKDQLGAALSDFVGDNFLNAELITAKIAQAEIPRQLGSWLSTPENAEKVSQEVGSLGAKALQRFDSTGVEEILQRVVIAKLGEPEWAPPLGRGLEILLAENRVEPVIDEVLQWAARKIAGAEDVIVALVDERRPLWAPRFVNTLVGEKLYRELRDWLQDVANTPQHAARLALYRWLQDLATDLQEDPALIQRLENWKQEVLHSQSVAQIGPSLWRSGATALLEALENPESGLRRAVVSQSQQWGQRLVTESELQDKANRRLVGVVAFLADNYADNITGIISETVAAWDAREASDKLELLVGKDLQFIRLNGTLVGALAGLLIHVFVDLLF